VKNSFKILCCLMLVIVCFSCGSPVETIEDAIPTDGLIVYYPLNGNAHDESGNGHHGAAEGAVNFSTQDRFGSSGSAIDIPDASSHIRIETHTDLEVQNHTISAWIKSDYNGNDGGVFDYGYERDHYAFRAGPSRLTHVINYPDDGCDHIYYTSVLEDSKWHHIVLTYNGNLSCIWVDGVMSSSHAFNKTIKYDIHERCYIGMNFPGGHDWFEGFIDDIRLFDRVLNEDEILALYYEGE